jgi:hypothetical protein
MAKHTKVTFTLDGATVFRLKDAAQRLSIPQSQVVREAVQEYHARIGKLREDERRRMLEDFDRLVPLIPSRPRAAVKKELAAIRASRRRGGRKSTEEHRP